MKETQKDRSKKFSKTLTLVMAAVFINLGTEAFAFDWPQAEIESDSFYSYFGQLRGGTLSSSLVFTNSTDIKSADEGRLIAVLEEHSEESDLFESTLGNAAIIAHNDNLLTVYANLDAQSNESREKLTTVATGTPLGECSNSGWQEGQGCLEFQVVDTRNRAFINPRVLLPRFGKELEITINHLSVTNKKGQEYLFILTKNLASGSYRIYKNRQEKAMPYRTTVYVNGAAVQTIDYDMLVQGGRNLCTRGIKSYSVKDLYPNNKKMLLAELNLARGKNIITVVASDILGQESTLTYNIDVR